MKKTIGAISFDFWDTLARDESDEPKRQKLHLPPKSEARLALIFQALSSVKKIHLDALKAEFERANLNFKKIWTDQYQTLTVYDRYLPIWKWAGCENPVGFKLLKEVVTQVEQMELVVEPDPILETNELQKVLGALQKKYKLGIISDTVHTPGQGLRELLRRWGVLGFFSGFVFSDEFGKSKPSIDVFNELSRQLGVPASEIVHVGDRKDKDVGGIRRVGGVAVLFTGAVNRGMGVEKEDIHCSDFRELPKLIEDFQNE